MSESAVSFPRTPSIFGSLRRYPALFLAVLIGCLALAALITAAVPTQSVATARLTLDDPRGNSVFRTANLPPEDLTTYTTGQATYAKSATVLNLAGSNLSPTRDFSYMSSHVSASVGSSSDVMVISAKAKSKAQAVAIANAVGDAYESLTVAATTKSLNAALAVLDKQRTQTLDSIKGSASNSVSRSAAASVLSSISSQVTTARTAAALFGDGVAQTDKATTGQIATSGSVSRNFIAGALIGILLGVGAVVALAARRRPIENVEQVQEALPGVIMLGNLTTARRGQVADQGYELIAAGLQSTVPRGVISLIPASSQIKLEAAVAGTGLALSNNGARVAIVASLAQAAAVREFLPRPSDVMGTPSGPELFEADTSRPADVQSTVSVARARAQYVLVLAPPVAAAGGPAMLQAADSAVLFVNRGVLISELKDTERVVKLVGKTLSGFVVTAKSLPEPSEPTAPRSHRATTEIKVESPEPPLFLDVNRFADGGASVT